MIRRFVRLGCFTVMMISAAFGLESEAQAQRGGFGGGGGGGRGMPTPEESFQRMDRNQNGLLDPDEIQQLPGFLKDMYARAGVDGSRAVNLQEFQGVSQKMREQFEQGRSSGQSQFRRPDSGGGGPPPGEMRPPGGDSNRRETTRPEEPADEDVRRDDRDRRRDDRDSSSRGSSKDSPSSKNAKRDKKPKPRVTKDLPDEYRERDKNNDGQIALYEWERSAFTKFYDLDRNGDGFLTPGELLPPPTKSDKDKKGASPSTSASAESKSGSSSAVISDPGRPAESAKPSSDTKPAALDSSPGAVAFQSLDVNKDGQLTQDEWERSRNTRRRFEKAKITVTLPVKQAQFVELYRKTEDS